MPQAPGGPTQIFCFEAAAEGEAEVRIPHTYYVTFTMTIQVGSAAGKGSATRASMIPDQANTVAWTKGWTSLLNDVRQTFTPSRPRLTSVEVELVVANTRPPDGEVTMILLNAEGEPLAVVSKTVPVADCGPVLFVLPNSGLQVSPGQVYSIRLIGGTLFGWKYVVSGYEKGAARLNGGPVLPDTKHVSVPDIRCELNIQHGPLVIGGQGREVAAARRPARRIEPRRDCQGRYLPRLEEEGEDGVLLGSPA